MKQYLDALQHIMDHGIDVPNRTGIDTRAVFGMQMRYDLSAGFPAVTTKRLAFKSVVAELLWFLSGSSDVRDLQKMGCHIWDANAAAPYWKERLPFHGGPKFEGDLGRVYGVQWRSWNVKTRPGEYRVLDQIENLLLQIQRDPSDRRLIVTAWNPGELEAMALPPCHMFFQVRILGGKLHLQMYQRSCDMFLGVPFNIASYALLTHMLAQVTGYEVGEFVHTLGDAHIYHNHIEQVREQLTREPYPLPRLWLNPDVTDILKFTPADVRLENYQRHEAISAPMAV